MLFPLVPDHPPSLLRSLRRKQQGMRLVLFWEQLWPRLTPLVLLALLYLTLGFAGFWRWIGSPFQFFGAAGWCAAFLASLWPLRTLIWPSSAQALARLERDAGYADHPLQALEDVPVSTHGLSGELWQAYQAQNLIKARAVQLTRPRPASLQADPYHLRAAMTLLVGVAWVSAGQNGQQPLWPSWPRNTAQEAAPRLDVWITPPPYTGVPARRLLQEQAQNPAEQVPQGSRITVRGTPRLVRWGKTAVAPNPAVNQETSAAQTYDIIAESAQDLYIQQRGAPLRWPIHIVPDHAPIIGFATPHMRTSGGSLRFEAALKDDYGVIAAQARFAPIIAGQEAPRSAPSELRLSAAPRPLIDPPDFALRLPSHRPRTGLVRVRHEMLRHPWAGSDVWMWLEAKDDAQLTGTSERLPVRLPARAMTQQTAQLLMAQRRLLALDANSAPHVALVLSSITQAMAQTGQPMGHYLAVRSLETRINTAQDDETLRTLIAQLEDVALLIEDGALHEAHSRLQQAQDRLEKALKQGASPQEISQLMQDMRAALAEFLQEVQQRAHNMPPQRGQATAEQQSADMMQRMENLARSGATQEAAQVLQHLRQMINQMRDGLALGKQQETQQIKELATLLREQRSVRDQTFQQRQNASPALDALQHQQRQLGEKLQTLTQGSKSNKAQNQAIKAMQQAAQNLKMGDAAAAVQAQGQALEHLRNALKQMQSEAQGQGQGQGQGQVSSSPFDEDGVQGLGDEGAPLPEEHIRQRSHEILEELRQRLADPQRPKSEQDYLEKLIP